MMTFLHIYLAGCPQTPRGTETNHHMVQTHKGDYLGWNFEGVCTVVLSPVLNQDLEPHLSKYEGNASTASREVHAPG